MKRQKYVSSKRTNIKGEDLNEIEISNMSDKLKATKILTGLEKRMENLIDLQQR